MIEYFFFIDEGWGIKDPYSYDWSKGIDENGDEYVMAISDSFYPTILYFYNLSKEKLDEEYASFTTLALSLNRDSDSETVGSIKEEYIFTKIQNIERKTFKYGDYIGNKIYFMDSQRIPYTKFNLVLERGAMVMDY